MPQDRSFILNSAVVTSPGLYRYQLIPRPEAKAWLEAQRFVVNTLGYAETVTAFNTLFDTLLERNRINIVMKPGEEALVFRLVFPEGTVRLPVDEKGNIDVQFVLDHHELGLLIKYE